jgi:hypothetical protein
MVLGDAEKAIARADLQEIQERLAELQGLSGWFLGIAGLQRMELIQFRELVRSWQQQVEA